MSSDLDFSTTGIITRSPKEIRWTLERILRDASFVESKLPGGLWSSRLVYVDPEYGYVLFAKSGDDAIDREILARSTVLFTCTARGFRTEFSTNAPEVTNHDGAEVIRTRYPHVMVTIHQRTVERQTVDIPTVLHVVVDAGGVISFDGHISDISKVGLGLIHYSPAITLEPGSILKGCRIAHPVAGARSFDMEIRYSTVITLADGTQRTRSGFRFMALTAEIEDLIEVITRHLKGRG